MQELGNGLGQCPVAEDKEAELEACCWEGTKEKSHRAWSIS